MGLSTVDCQNNTVASITTATADSAHSTHFYGIYSGTTSVRNNKIGSNTVANSIYASSKSTSSTQKVFGIWSICSGSATISGNTIANMKNGTTNSAIGTGGLINGIYIRLGINTVTNNTIHDLSISNSNNAINDTASVIGIVLYITSSVVAQNISHNTIHSISNNRTNFAGGVIGIYYNGANIESVVSGNFIHSLSVHSSTTDAIVFGIKINSGLTIYSNNIIVLGGDTRTTLFGIYELGGALSDNNSICFNTIYISGNPSVGSRNSYALVSINSNSTRNFRNNIFVNERSNSGSATGKHYAILTGNTDNTKLTIDYNDYFVSGTGGVLGHRGSTEYLILADWQAATGQDVNSKNINPNFESAGGTAAADYLPSNDLLIGLNGTGITTDYFGTQRNKPIKMGAIDFITKPLSQPTSLEFSSSGSDPYNILLRYFPSESAGKYLVVRKTGSAPSFIPSDGIEYTTGAQGEDYIVHSGTDTFATDASVSNNSYHFKIFAFNGAGNETQYLTTNALSGYVIISTNGVASIPGSGTVSTGFPNAGVNITFPNGTSGTDLTVAKTNSVPASNFAALPGVRGMKNLYFTINSNPSSAGTYTLILDFSSLDGMNETKWNSFKIMKRANSTEAWKDVTAAPINAAIVNRQTDGVWGKFTISGLTSFSEFGGGEESVTHTVTSASNDINVANSLRNLINSSVAGDVITFDTGAMGTNIITLADSAIFIYKDLTIRGVDGGVTLNGNNTTMVLAVGESINNPLSPVVRLERLKITGGNDTQNRVGGVDNFGALTMVNCIIADNIDLESNSETGAVGGILSNGDLYLVNSTIANNKGKENDDGVGGVYCGGTNYEIYNSILYGNTGQIQNVDGNISIARNSLFGEAEEDIFIADKEGCIFEGNPQFVGSGAHPYLIMGISPCADAGNNSFCFESKDIRGTDRKLNKDDATSGSIDIGAYEYKFGEDPLPVELSSFRANVSKKKVILNWETNTEINNYGFEVERKPLTVETGHALSLQNPTSPIWSKIGFVSGAGNSNSVKEYSFTDKDIKGGKYQYRLKQIDNDGKFSYSEVIEVDVALPAEFRLEQNYPNPFNPTTTIEYQLPVNSLVKIELYSITGEKVATLVNGELEAGYYNITLNASELRLSSGIYLYRLITNNYTSIKKMVVIK